MYSKYFALILVIVTHFLHGVSTSRRFKRQQFRSVPSCTVSHQEVEELIRITTDLNSAVESVSLDIRSGFDEEAANRDRCSKQLGQFRDTVMSIIQSYKSIDRSKMSQAQYDRAKARYQGDIQRLLRRVDNLKRDVEEKYKGEMERLRTNMQNFKSQVDDYLDQLEQERVKIRSCSVRLVIANVRARRMKDAVNEFVTLSDRPYNPIVTDIYEDEPQNTELVMDFLEAIDLHDEPVVGYEVLYPLIKRNNQLGGTSGRRFLLALMAMINADDENTRRAQQLLRTFKSEVH
ncbi:uncharacterized protein LOC5578774 [Aedes aegypti]|uniref:Uncharacterized protein n=1 Tax=Aedes aegypti TaxID=7159 RepID=A0A1S4F592_AEDAE|nr:uncharacterized protein LOC5578774 [Aedes aegypti]